MKKVILFICLTIFSFSYGNSQKIIIKSSAFKNGEFIPKKYTCDNIDVSPPLRWKNIPSKAKSLVIIMEDPDAPGGTFIHWIIYDIPVSKSGLPENFPKKETVGNIKQGINDFGTIGYGGPCPPPGKPHRYFFRIYALDIKTLKLPPGATINQIKTKIKNHTLATGELMGKYRR